MANKTFNVSADFILKAHKAACSDWKQRLEDEFPQLFQDLPFRFGNDDIKITTNVDEENFPLYIGHGNAPAGLQDRCLMVPSNWEVEVFKQDVGGGMDTVLTFRKKS